MTGKNRIMIYGPKDDGRYVVEFQIAEVDVLAISIPRTVRSECRMGCMFRTSTRTASVALLNVSFAAASEGFLSTGARRHRAHRSF
jgi:hypothetical protein